MSLMSPLASGPVPYLVVLGCGQVGRALVEMVLQGGVRANNPHSSKLQPVRILAVTDSQHGVISQRDLQDGLPSPSSSFSHRPGSHHGHHHGLSDKLLKQVLACKRGGEGFASMRDSLRPGEDGEAPAAVLELEDVWDALLRKFKRQNIVVADCTASSKTSQHIAVFLREGIGGVVLANKLPLSGAFGTFEWFVNHEPFFRWESTVGAGSPFVTSLKRMVSGGDVVTSVSGVFSGTLGFVMTGLEDGKPMSEVVRDAKKQGYTEPDPRDDLSGTDFARKALILSRMMGWQVEMSDIELESLVPEELSQSEMPLAEFLRPGGGLETLDQAFRDRVEAARKQGKVLRYAATLDEGGKCKVGLVEVGSDTPLGRLRGTDNVLAVKSEIYDEAPLVIQGRGAGPHCTALGIIADAVEIFNVNTAKFAALRSSGSKDSLHSLH